MVDIVRSTINTVRFSLSQTHTHTHAVTRTHTHMLSHVHTRCHTYTHTHTLIYTHTHLYTYTHTHTRCRTYTHTHTHTLSHVHTHTHTHTHPYTHTHTHTHTWTKKRRNGIPLGALQIQMDRTLSGDAFLQTICLPGGSEKASGADMSPDSDQPINTSRRDTPFHLVFHIPTTQQQFLPCYRKMIGR